MDAKEEIRSRLNIEDIVGEYVQLKRAGRNFKGLSPFTSEKTPSFYVSPDKNIWHDFSSNKGGDIFSFVMEVEGMDFRESLAYLARKAGVDLSMYENKGAQARARQKKQLLEINRLAANYFQHSLLRNPHALEYVFKKRKLNKEIVQQFQIGYAPNSGKALVGYLKKKGFNDKELRDGGVLTRYGGDLFRGRMTVPLMDASGQVIGFTGRIIDDIPHAPKYLNTPQTLLYDKGRHVFGLSQAKQAIRQQDRVVIVEGNLDVISSHQAGVCYVVATAGTAMTEYHLRALKRLTGDVRLAFDGDKAGIAATERAIGLASHVGVELSVISIPKGAKDPDELIQQGVEKWTHAIETSQPAVDWLLSQYSQRLDLNTAAGKRQLTTVGLAVVSQLKDPVEREHYERKIADMVHSSLSSILEKAEQKPLQKSTLKMVKNKTTVAQDPYVYQDDALAAASLDAAGQELFAHIDITLFEGDSRQALARYYAKNHNAPLKDVPEKLQKFDEYVTMVLLRAEARYSDWDDNDRYFETARLLRQIENEHKKQMKQELLIQLREAEGQDDDNRADSLRNDLNKLIKEIARGKK
ncbi:MAG: DNA primase [Candidatus Saccharimonas sp.]